MLTCCPLRAFTTGAHPSVLAMSTPTCRMQHGMSACMSQSTQVYQMHLPYGMLGTFNEGDGRDAGQFWALFFGSRQSHGTHAAAAPWSTIASKDVSIPTNDVRVQWHSTTTLKSQMPSQPIVFCETAYLKTNAPIGADDHCWFSLHSHAVVCSQRKKGWRRRKMCCLYSHSSSCWRAVQRGATSITASWMCFWLAVFLQHLM